MKLLVDDTRGFEDVDMIVRDPLLAKEVITVFGDTITHLYLDNDMGATIEGWELLNWILRNSVPIPNVQLVTSNSSAAGRMELALENYGYIKKGAWWVY